MKTILVILIMFFAINANALTTYKGGTTTLPEPLPESAGQLIYEEMGCAICHGYQGGGDGFLSEGLNPKPRDFTSFEQMARLPDMIMIESIRNGIPHTAMPASDLTDNQILDVISYIKTFLADSQMTFGVCWNEQRTIDLENVDFYGDFDIELDREQFIAVVSKDNKVLIKPKDFEVLKYFKATKRRIIRTHIMIRGQEQDADSVLLVVRIQDCFK